MRLYQEPVLMGRVKIFPVTPLKIQHLDSFQQLWATGCTKVYIPLHVLAFL